jgi:predicted O-methyltransferase YrrM
LLQSTADYVTKFQFGRSLLLYSYKLRGLILDTNHVDDVGVASLLGISTKEVHTYLAELESSGLTSYLYSQFKKNTPAFGMHWQAIGAGSLYAITRIMKPEVFLETGVWWGVSSTCILEAMEKNQKGTLISIDTEPSSGWMIPERLRKRWKFLVGMSSDVMPDLLRQLGSIDVFLHDSDHSYKNMRWELEEAYPHVRDGGVFLADDVHMHTAFQDFSKEKMMDFHTIFLREMRYSKRQMGGCRKGSRVS